jgi:MFS family permease
VKDTLRSVSFTYSDTDAPSRWRDVYLAAVARAISACGTFMAVTALVLTLQRVSGYAVSALILASTVPVVLLAPLAGRLADRVDSRTLLVSVGAAKVAVALTLAFTGELVAVVALMALLGAGQAVIGPTLAALTPSMVRREDLPQASAINQTAHMIGMLTGPAIGGVLVGVSGVRLPLLLNAAGLVAIVAAGVLVRTRRGGAPARAASAGSAPSAAGEQAAAAPDWKLWHDPLLRAMVVSLAAVTAAVGAMNVVEVFLVRDTLGASEAMYGLLQATWTAGMLAGTWVLARAARRARDDGALVYGLLAALAGLCAMLPLAAMVGAAVWLIPLWLIGGAGNGGLNVFGNVLFARRAPEQHRGRAYATLAATVHGAGMAGYAAGGLLVEAFPIRPLVAGLGLAGLTVVALLAGPVARTVRRERAATPARTGQPEPAGAPG